MGLRTKGFQGMQPKDGLGESFLLSTSKRSSKSFCSALAKTGFEHADLTWLLLPQKHHQDASQRPAKEKTLPHRPAWLSEPSLWPARAMAKTPSETSLAGSLSSIMCWNGSRNGAWQRTWKQEKEANLTDLSVSFGWLLLHTGALAFRGLL